MSFGRRIWNALGFGTLSLVNDGGPVQTAQVKVGSATILDAVPVVQLFGISGNPPVGADAVMVSINGDPSNSVLIATNHQSHRPTGQASGEMTIYNAQGMSIYLSANGIVVNGGGKNITIENAPTITSDAARFQVKGDIIDHYDTQPNNMADMRSIYDSHTHPGVQAGGDNTGVPNQPE